MIDVNQVYTEFLNLANKDQNSGNFSPDVANQHFKLAQLNIVKRKFNSFGNGAYERFSEDTSSLSSLKKKSTINVVDGKVTKPDDWLYYSSATYSSFYSGKPITIFVEYLRDNEMAVRQSSEIDAPTKEYPAISEYNGYFKVMPEDLSQLEFTYIKLPEDPIWGYTISNNRPVYDSSASTNFELDDDDYGDLLYEICRLAGVEVREPFLFQSADALDNKQ